MNEPRVIVRICVCCGVPFEIKLSGINHWWEDRKIKTKCFHGDFTLNLRTLRSKFDWTSKFLPFAFKSKSKFNQFLSDRIWWWSIPEAECTVPNWKKPYLMIRGKIEDFLDPPERIEYWECTKCIENEETKNKTAETIADWMVSAL